MLPSEGVFEGDEVISIDVDLDGDGEQERLVTLKLGNQNGKFGNIWHVLAKRGNSFKEVGTVTFRIDNATILTFPVISGQPRLYSSRNRDVMFYGIIGGKAFESPAEAVSLDEFRTARSTGKKPVYRSIPAADLYHKYKPEELEGVLIAQAQGSTAKSRPDAASVRIRNLQREQQQDAITREEPSQSFRVYIWVAGGIGLLLVAGYILMWRKN